jgi:hypothetical protein
MTSAMAAKLHPMKPIDNVHHAIAAALTERLKLSHLVVTAWRKTETLRIAEEAVRALGVSKPEVELDDIIANAHIDTVAGLALGNSTTTATLVDDDDVEQATTEFLTLIARATQTESKKFLQQARRQVHAAIALSMAARLDCVSVEEHYQATPIDQAISFVVEVADYWRDYKQQNEMVDIADIFAGELEPIDNCEFCLLDRRGMPPLAMQALRRLLPKAYFVTV